jgi:hypothetical protein
VVLAWLDGAREGFRPQQMQYLWLSYQLGPNKGWIAARRNRFALTIFERLPPALAEYPLDEFARMLGSGFYGESIENFIGPGWTFATNGCST